MTKTKHDCTMAPPPVVIILW